MLTEYFMPLLWTPASSCLKLSFAHCAGPHLITFDWLSSLLAIGCSAPLSSSNSSWPLSASDRHICWRASVRWLPGRLSICSFVGSFIYRVRCRFVTVTKLQKNYFLPGVEKQFIHTEVTRKQHL